MTLSDKQSIHICRVYTPPAIKEGTWILVDRLWPRGLKKETLAFDLWPKEITPGTALRQWFHADPNERWNEFVHRYIEELQSQTALIEQIQDMAKHGTVTLFYAAKDTQRNHALVLQQVICSWPKQPDERCLHL